MIEQLNSPKPTILGFKLSGKLHDADYQHFTPAIDAAVQAHGKIRLLALFEDFHGWDVHAAWDDLKMGLKHYSDIERIAIIGDKAWEKWMTIICKPFTKATIHYFDAAQLADAWAWVEKDQ